MTIAPPPPPSPLPVADRRRPDRARWWPRLQLLGGALVVVIVLRQLGTGPFLAGLAALTVPAVLAAMVIGAVTTVACAWRWRIVAERLGLRLRWGPAIAAYYGSQFLNSTLPGGVLGDVDRAVRHGRTVEDVGRGARAVAGERAAGPLVHVGLTVLVVALVPGPALSWLLGPVILLGGLLIVAGAVLLIARGTSRWSRLAGVVAADLRTGVLAREAWPRILLASVVVAVGPAVLFVIAARLVGVPAGALELVPVAMVVLAAMLVPINVGGWGPRESVAAEVFGAAGWGAGTGVAAATAFGALTLIATTPGLVVLLARPLSRSTLARSIRTRSAGRTREVGDE